MSHFDDLEALFEQHKEDASKNKNRRLLLDVSTILALQECIDDICNKDNATGHGSVVLDISQFRFHGTEHSVSRLLPQESKRKQA